MDPLKQFEAMKNGFHDLSKMNEKEEDAFVPPSDMVFRVDGESSGMAQEQEPIANREQRHANIPLNDSELFPGGPLMSEVDSWRKQFGNVYIVDDIVEGEIHIFRTLNRFEYKSIIATPNTDQICREEMICEQAVLYPYEYSYGIMSDQEAGIPSIVSEHILRMSGFTKASMPRRL